jgi:cytidylate kinase
MPNTFNMAILGPKKSGKRTLANMLSSIYGWKVLDVEKIVQE